MLEVLRSGQLSLGSKLGEFERLFAGRLAKPHGSARANPSATGPADVPHKLRASAVSSGTAGLHLALRAVGVKGGDEVITSPFSFVASANTILYERAIPVFADIDPVTLNLDPGAAEAAITERTKAILPVHIFGYPADMQAFEGIAEKHGLAIVEDACEALGGVHGDGVPVGGRGHPAVFGFYANKQITTGEGGMVVVGNEGIKEQIDSERNQGRAPDMGWLDHDRLGFNYRLSDLACALGLAQLERLDQMLVSRARVAAIYRDALAGVQGVEMLCEDGAGSDPGARRGWFVFVVRLPPWAQRDEIIRRLAQKGIQSKAYLPAIHLMSFYRKRFGYRPGQLPVCEEVAARSLALPFWPGMGQVHVERVALALADVVGR